MSESIEGEDLRTLLGRGPANLPRSSNGAARPCPRSRPRTRPASCTATSSPRTSFIRSDGYLKIVDFGLAKQVHASNNLTGEKVVGTLAYMAPEKLRGEPRFAALLQAMRQACQEDAESREPVVGL